MTPIATNKADATVTFGDHAAHHNALGVAVNALDRVRVIAEVVGDGVANDTAALQAAITAAGAYGTVAIPQGAECLTDELDVAVDGLVIDAPGVVLKARSNSVNVLHWSGSNGEVHLAKIDDNGKTGVTGLRLTPQDEAQTSTEVHQNFNRFHIGEIVSCAEGVVMKAGPKVGGADSGCWYNRFYSLHAKFCTRGLWMKVPTTTPGSDVNRNQFFGCRFGQAGMNTGLQIDAGSTNTFFGTSFEGIDTGSSPNATPTAVKIAATGAGDNNSNVFFGTMFEANDLDVENDNAYTEFHGHNIGFGKLDGAALPLYLWGGDPSQQPVTFPGFRYPEGSLVGADSVPTFTKPLALAVYTEATKPAANSAPGGVIYVSDGAAGSKFQGSTGAAWVGLG